MAFSAYLVSASFSDSASETTRTTSFQTSNDDGIGNTVQEEGAGFSTPTRYSNSSSGFSDGDAFAGAQDSYVVNFGSTVFSQRSFEANATSSSSSGYTDTGASPPIIDTYTGSGSDYYAYFNESISISDFPYITFRHTYSQSETSNNLGVTNSSTSSSTGIGVSGANFLYFYSTFTYTTTYLFDYTVTEENTSYVYLIDTNGSTIGTDSTTFSFVALSSGSTSTDTFTGTRAQDFSLYTSPQGMTGTYEVKHFRGVGQKYPSLGQQPLLRGFTQTIFSAFINNCNFLLNESMSTSFTFSHIPISAGTSQSERSGSTYLLSTNEIVVNSTYTTSLASYSTYEFEHGGKTFGFFHPSTTFEYIYSDYSESSGTISFQVDESIQSISSDSNITISAYCFSHTTTILTTSTYEDISANSISFITASRSRTIQSTSSVLRATNTALANGGGTTEYIFNSMNFASLYPALTTPTDFYSFSSQKMINGNFIASVGDDTAYWEMQNSTFAGIFDFSCLGIRKNIISQAGTPKFYRFTDCTVVCPYDPVSTEITSISIVQSVIASSNFTSFTQLLSWISSNSFSATTYTSQRIFDLSYENSTGTMPWTFDSVNDMDTSANIAFKSPSKDSSVSIYPSPAIFIDPEKIFNTVGQLQQASYMADGAYFKLNESSMQFVVGTYSNPISLELGSLADNTLASMNILKVTAPDPYNQGALFYMPMKRI